MKSSITGTPTKSRTAIRLMSPVTPKGRAGLPSPEKRGKSELDRSAVRRARRTTVSMRLKEEEDDYGTDREDVDLANEIIGGSREHFWSDVEMEEDEEGGEEDEEGGEEDEEGGEGDDSDEYTPQSPTRRTKGRSLRSRQPQKSRQQQKSRRLNESAAKSPKSVFQSDDEFLLPQKRSRSPVQSPLEPRAQSPTQSPLEPSAPQESLFSLPPKSPPILNGMPTEARSTSPELALFPMPKIGLDGEIDDDEYIQKYLSTVDWKREKDGGVADDRANFYDGPEGYFDQMSNRDRHSLRLLAQLGITLDYDEFSHSIDIMNNLKLKERSQLKALYRELFHQWMFELSQGFSLCFYGVGSKLDLIKEFTHDYFFGWYHRCMLGAKLEDYPKMMVINGYNPHFRFTDILGDIVSVFIDEDTKRKHNLKFPRVLSETIPTLISQIVKSRTEPVDQIRPRLVLVVQNLDGESLRDDRTQNYLCQLCSIPEVWLITSVDHINVSLLWDLYKLENYRFLWHDITCYDPYTIELSFKDIVNTGKSKKFIGSRGAKFVLSALNANSKALYHILMELQLENLQQLLGKNQLAGAKGSIKTGVEFKTFHTKCREQFITSNDISFRAMLGEFVEHGMCVIARVESGTEVVYIPYSYEEIVKIRREARK